MTFLRLTILTGLAALTLAGCGDVRESLGLGRSSPDEFAVVDRPPLAMPPDFGLRPPRPGQPRPQDIDPSVKASDALFGADKSGATMADISATTDTANISGSEQTLLAKTGADKANPNIRNVINTEAAQKTEVSQHLAQELLFWQKKQPDANATVVDAKAEAARIKETQSEGKPIDQGATPVIERQKSGGFLGL